MELLATKGGREVWLRHIDRPLVFERPFSERHYVAIVFNDDASISDGERHYLTQAMFATGCRYGVFAGHQCEDWEWALDTACIESALETKPSDDEFTMTTSHKNESVEDVIFFGLNNTSFDSHDFERILILFVGTRSGLRDEVEAAIRSVWFEGSGSA